MSINLIFDANNNDNCSDFNKLENKKISSLKDNIEIDNNQTIIHEKNQITKITQETLNNKEKRKALLSKALRDNIKRRLIAQKNTIEN